MSGQWLEIMPYSHQCQKGSQFPALAMLVIKASAKLLVWSLREQAEVRVGAGVGLPPQLACVVELGHRSSCRSCHFYVQTSFSFLEVKGLMLFIPSSAERA